MGGKTLKFPKRAKYRQKTEEIEVKKEAPKEEDVKALLDLWQSKKEKKK